MTEDLSLQNILLLLADGKFHSGQELGDILGVSRTAVWKHLQKLTALGLPVTTVKGKGYCLKDGLDLLNESEIRRHLASETQMLLSELDIRMIVDSTNTCAMKNGGSYGNGYVCVAEQQTAGKGRRGRQWISPFGKNIYLSLVWNFEGAAVLEGLSLAVGVAIADALKDCGVTDIELKWPNDLLWRGRKLAGVLLEMSGDPSGACQLVVGIGINVSMPEVIATEIDQPWVDIQSILTESGGGSGVTRNQLIAALLTQLLPMMQTYAEKKFSTYRARWEMLNAHANQCVELRTAKDLIVGTLLGVNDSGALRLETTQGEQLFYGGEVSLRAIS
jgi:BirA family biotin operon repressor/biotin-[acetyl-CoA-carboxylase] ligase